MGELGGWLRLAFVAAVPLACSSTKSAPSPAAGLFEKHTIDTAYRAEGVGVLDVDRDGHLDIATDQFWYAGPSFVPHEIRAPETYDPATAYADAMAVYPWDVDADGWIDLVVAPRPTEAMYWYENPHGADTHWAQHLIAAAGVLGLETPMPVDLFGDGSRVLLTSDATDSVLGWSAPAADPTAPWAFHPISGPGFPGAGVYQHGIGAGDVDGDGRLDVLTGLGWFGQTGAIGRDGATWTFHPFAFGPDTCSRMHVLDLNGDGAGDVLCSNPHSYGFHWFSQTRAASPGADPTFTAHLIDDTLSQMHALLVADLDGDGRPELVSGKRWWAHTPPGDPGEDDPAVVTYYAWTRGSDGSPVFARHDVDDASGVGPSFAIDDVDGDGKKDIVVSNKKGLFYFHQRVAP